MMLRPVTLSLFSFILLSVSLPVVAASSKYVSTGARVGVPASFERDLTGFDADGFGNQPNNVLILAQADTGADEQPAEPENFAWSVELDERGNINLAGDVPSEGFGKFLSIRAGADTLNTTRVAIGAPEGFTGATVAAVNAVKALNTGRIAFENGSWSLIGSVDSLATRQSILESLGRSVDLLTWHVSLRVAPADESMNTQAPSQVDPAPQFEMCVDAVAGFAETHTILFAPASAQLTEESLAALPLLARELIKCPDAQVHVAGHTDADGPANDNMTLSVRRAESVVDALIDAGVSDSRLYAIGYGETLPIASNDTRAGKALNRRIVFKLKQDEE